MFETFALIFISALLGALLFYWMTKWLLRKKLKKRFDRASIGELEAEELLKDYGYTLEDTQKSTWLSMWVDGDEYTYLVRPDAYASKKDKRYLVEIKTGKKAINPKHSATRRQLLEYYYSFDDVDGILLINAEEKRILHIHFKEPESGLKEALEQKALEREASAQASV